jgi:hypothetical protein
VEQRLVVFESHFVDVTPHPIFARLKRANNGMVHRMKMFGGVLILGRIAAADFTARQAQPQVHPFVADLEALFAAFRFGFHRLDLIEMRAFGGHSFPRFS